eukprot:GHVU01112568.1.p3 GENE.GHVU01112568.1~~GHVU01112568.1.p3  ORF type:complete len:153 (-),score=57.27 GHVU01112568.1:459-917(-)
MNEWVQEDPALLEAEAKREQELRAAAQQRWLEERKAGLLNLAEAESRRIEGPQTATGAAGASAASSAPVAGTAAAAQAASDEAHAVAQAQQEETTGAMEAEGKAYVPVPSTEDIHALLLEKKKRTLLDMYVSAEEQRSAQEAKDLVDLQKQR